jgi:hypothetical protein
LPFGNLREVDRPETGLIREPCERRDARDRRETASGRPSPAQVTDLRRCNQVQKPAVSRGVEPFAEQAGFWPISRSNFRTLHVGLAFRPGADGGRAGRGTPELKLGPTDSRALSVTGLCQPITWSGR